MSMAAQRGIGPGSREASVECGMARTEGERAASAGATVGNPSTLRSVAPVGKRSGPRRQPGCHVDADPDRRARKAEKVVRIIQRLVGRQPGGWALDIGCGAGYIADRLRARGWKTVALDVADYRAVRSFDFIISHAESLPFPSGTFSVVVSNHVIEHVGDAGAHLSEVHRVMAPRGVAYLATPNRLSILEPHYKLPLLSWLPQGMADGYVRLLRRGSFYDVFPLTRGDLLRRAMEAGLTCEDITRWTIAETGAVEDSWLARLLGGLPDRLLRGLSRVSPTFVFAMRPPPADQRDAQA